MPTAALTCRPNRRGRSSSPQNTMIKLLSLSLVVACMVFPLSAAPAHGDTDYLWDIRIQPVQDGSGRFTFDAELLVRSLTDGASSRTDLHIPRITVVPGEEANIEIKGPDGKPALTGRVLIDEGASQVRYSVMIRAEDGTHSSSAELDLSVAAGAAQESGHNKDDWQRLVDKIEVGMKRSEVEQILSSKPKELVSITGGWNSASYTYHLDARRTLSIVYRHINRSRGAEKSDPDEDVVKSPPRLYDRTIPSKPE